MNVWILLLVLSAGAVAGMFVGVTTPATEWSHAVSGIMGAGACWFVFLVLGDAPEEGPPRG